MISYSKLQYKIIFGIMAICIIMLAAIFFMIPPVDAVSMNEIKNPYNGYWTNIYNTYNNSYGFNASSNISTFNNPQNFTSTSINANYYGSSITVNNGTVNESYAYLPGRAGGQTLTGSTSTGGLTLNGSYSNGNVSILPSGGGYLLSGSQFLMRINGDAISTLKTTSSTGQAALVNTNDIGARAVINSISSNFASSTFRNNVIIGADTGNSRLLIYSTGTNAPISFATGSLTNDRMTIGPLGDVGIFNTTPTRALDIAAGVLRVRSCSGTPTFDAGGNMTCSSDPKLKSKITLFTNSLSAISNIHPICWEWNKESDYVGSSCGFNASEIKTVIPSAVIEREDIKKVDEVKKGLKSAVGSEEDIIQTSIIKTGEKTQSIDQTQILATVVNALKEEDSKNAALEKRVADLEARLEKAGIK